MGEYVIMRNRQEILKYLLLPEDWDTLECIDEIVETAHQIEQEYEEELSEGSIGYGLLCDFNSSPDILEDCEIEKIAEVNGIVIYKKLEDN